MPNTKQTAPALSRKLSLDDKTSGKWRICLQVGSRAEVSEWTKRLSQPDCSRSEAEERLV